MHRNGAKDGLLVERGKFAELGGDAFYSGGKRWA